MARRFRRSFRRGRSSKRRKVYWTGGFVQFDNVAQANISLGTGGVGWAGEVYTFWVKWPSGYRSNSSDIAYTEEIEPIDETLAKTVVNWGLQASLDNLTEFQRHSFTAAFGITTYDAGEYADYFNSAILAFDSGVGSPPNVPLPLFDLNEDWVYRFVCPGTQNRAIWPTSVGTAYQESRAQRKLPHGTGLLGILALSDLNESHTNDWTVTMALDIRLLMRAGVYSP